MADSPALVGLGVRSPDMVGKLSALLSIKQQQQQLRAQTAEASGAVQSQDQRAGIANYMKAKLGTHVNEDGTVDTVAIANDPDFLSVAGDAAPQILSNLNTVRSQQIEAKQNLFNLNESQRKGVVDTVTAGLSDPDIMGIDPHAPDAEEKNAKAKQKLNVLLEQYYESHGKDVIPAIAAYAPAIKNAPPGALPNVLKTMQLSTMDVSKQIAARTPNLVSTGDKLTNINPSADQTPDMKIGLPPGVYLNKDGAQFVVDENGKVARELGTGGGSGNGEEPRKFLQPGPGQKDLEEHVSKVREADSDITKGYGASKHVNEEILRLSADTATGPGTATWHKIIGQVTGLGGGNQIADYQKIGAYLDRQAAQSATQMGLPNTNAGLDTAASLSGTTDYTPEALQTKVNLTDALVEGAHQYRNGLDKLIGTGKNQDLSNLGAFRKQWSDNFDPNIYRAENALKRGDKQELKNIQEEVGTRGMAELKVKRDNLHKLEAGELLK
jgi:hypothetical protein